MSSKILFFLLLNISLISSIRLRDNDFFTPEMRSLVHKIYKLSKSKTNIFLMNLLTERLKKLIYSRDFERADVPKDKYKDIQEKKKNFNITSDGTYDLYTYEKLNFEEGYQASFETLNDPYTSEDYDTITYKLSLMTDNKVYIGVWKNEDEFSFHFDDLELATVICIMYNQKALFEWATEKDINNPYVTEIS